MNEMVRLGDVFIISSGGTPNKKHNEYYEGGTIPWIKTGDLKEMYISNHVEYITQLGLENSSAKIFPINTVLVAMYGATIGACSILPFEAATNQACAAFLPSETILPNYLFYFLCSKKDQFVKDGVGGAQPNISAAYLKNVEIQIPSLNRQKFIISVLDKVSKLIALRKRQLDLLDEMVKARFVEMFGDPVKNEKGWETDSVGKICYVTKLAGFEYTQYIKYKDNGEVIMIRGLNVKNNKLKLDDVYYIDQATSDMLPRSQLHKDDIVMTYIGVNIGDVALVDGNNKYHLAPNVAKISPYSFDTINPLFFVNLLSFNKKNFASNATNTAKQALNMDKIRKLVVMLPPIELQNQFADFVQQVDKSKATVQQALEKLNLLKSALMQEYFG